MDWRRMPQDDPDDPDGIVDLARRFESEVGPPPLRGTTFIHDAATMLAHTRAIEAAVRGLGTDLWVGFQTADKLDQQASLYEDLIASGTSVTAFGSGRPVTRTGVRWCEVPEDPVRLENQWFLVARRPEPIAFVGYETSPDRLRAVGPAGGPGKAWSGFVTDDERLIDAIAAYLSDVAEDTS